MTEQNIRAAIESRLATWASGHDPVLRVAWQNVPFTPTSGETYLKAFLLPASTTSADLAGAHRAHLGVYQVSIVCPINIGSGAAAGIVDEIESLFPLNQRMSAGGLTVQVIRPVSAAPALTGDATFTVPVSFGYRVDTI